MGGGGDQRFLVHLEGLIGAAVKGFHADNGSEYVNQHVAEPTSCTSGTSFQRQRLVEGKNGSVVRKLATATSPRRSPPRSTTRALPDLNFHRPCLFPTEVEDDKGRRKRRYRDEDVATPYERLRSLPDAEGLRGRDSSSSTQWPSPRPTSRPPRLLFRRIGEATPWAG